MSVRKLFENAKFSTTAGERLNENDKIFLFELIEDFSDLITG